MLDYLAMNGYAFYVWGSYGVAALCIAGEVIALKSRLRAAKRSAGRHDSTRRRSPS